MLFVSVYSTILAMDILDSNQQAITIRYSYGSDSDAESAYA